MDFGNTSGQIIATSREFSPQMVVKSKGNPLISEKSRLVKYYNLARKHVTEPGDDFFQKRSN